MKYFLKYIYKHAIIDETNVEATVSFKRILNTEILKILRILNPKKWQVVYILHLAILLIMQQITGQLLCKP